MQWLMLQQEQPEDFVIATGRQIAVRQFVVMTAREAGLVLEFEGIGVAEIGRIAAVIDRAKAPAVKVGDPIIRIDPRYFRPAEVETLLGDPGKAKAKLGWEPEITVEEMCAEMVAADLDTERQHALLKSHGHHIAVAKE
jgi:GDPmannose 4,6-dehydratase